MASMRPRLDTESATTIPRTSLASTSGTSASRRCGTWSGCGQPGDHAVADHHVHAGVDQGDRGEVELNVRHPAGRDVLLSQVDHLRHVDADRLAGRADLS